MGSETEKIYDFDENGEKIPVIGKKTGQQKVDKQNREQWKCHTADSTDWNSKDNAKMWRKDLVDTINAANEQLGIALHWGAGCPGDIRFAPTGAERRQPLF